MSDASAATVPHRSFSGPFPWLRPDFGEVTALRGQAPTAPFRTLTVAGEPIWIITRYAEVRALLADARLSADPHRSGFPLLGRFLPPEQPTPFMRTDPPLHTAFRSVLAGHFTRRAAAAAQPTIEAIATGLIDELEHVPAGHADLVSDFAVPLSMQVILGLLGLPTAPWRDVAELATQHMCASPLTDRDQLRRSLRTGQVLTGYLDREVRLRESGPAGRDVIDSLLRAAQAGQIPRGSIATNLFLLVIAGHDTSAGMLAGTMLRLLGDPHYADRLRAQPSLIPAAVEESLRQLTIVHQMTLRASTADIHVGGRTIPAREGVALMLYSANHDSHRFRDPERFDPDRDTAGHLAFGHGVHRCIGQSLARAELAVGIRLLLQRFPRLRLRTAIGNDHFKPRSPIQGLLSLPVQL
ncbi:MAG TPA: cytochrome P450 [Jatrophihabitans sp.]|nr:cytochrome P450 [Jatrophihabitans sp.]